MGHTALGCYHRMNFAFQGKHPSTKLAAMAFSSNALTSNCWVSNSGATDHCMPDLANIQQAKEYNRNDGVTVHNSQTLPITHTGNAQLRALKHILHLRHTLRVPNMKSNILYVLKRCKDNNCSFHFNATKLSIQDVHSGRVLYKGLNEAGLYPIYMGILSTQNLHPSLFQSFPSQLFILLPIQPIQEPEPPHPHDIQD